MNGNIRTKVEIIEKIGRNSTITETYDIIGDEEVSKKSMWRVSYSTNYPAEFCDHFGQFKSCLNCESLVIDDENKGLCHCARSYEAVSYKVMEARLKEAMAHGCRIKIW